VGRGEDQGVKVIGRHVEAAFQGALSPWLFG
jgi:hypothetical protein